MFRDERGLALVSVILMTAVIMVIVSIVTYKVIRSTSASGTVGLKSKTYYAANGGLENARVELDAQYESSSYWQDFLDPDTAPGYTGPATNPQPDLYLAVDNLLPAGFATVPPINLQILIKDNNDGDDNYAVDTDQLVMVNVQAQRAGDDTQTMVETRLLFDDSRDSYSQLGGGPGREHFRNVSGISDPTTLNANTETLDLAQ